MYNELIIILIYLYIIYFHFINLLTLYYLPIYLSSHPSSISNLISTPLTYKGGTKLIPIYLFESLSFYYYTFSLLLS
jgi:hypothetical protein